MVSTIVLFSVLFGYLLVSLALWGLLLKIGLRWARVVDITTRRIATATVGFYVLLLLQNTLFRTFWPAPESEPQSILRSLSVIAAFVIMPCVVISIVFKTRPLRALQAWLPTLLWAIMAITFNSLVWTPFLYSELVVSDDAMAPTLLGKHWLGACSKCGRPNYCFPQTAPLNSLQMICDEFHVTFPASVRHP